MKKQIFLLCLSGLICSFSTLYIHQKMKASSTKVYALRLRPNEDLKKSLMAFAKKENLKAAYIITCVGSLQKANIRFANQPNGTAFTDKFEIVSLVGAFNTEGGIFTFPFLIARAKPLAGI
jgi:uncharacterized protein